MKKLFVLALVLFSGLAYAQDPQAMGATVTANGETVVETKVFESDAAAAEHLRRDQAEEVARGKQVRTAIISERPVENLPRFENNPHLFGSTYTILVPDKQNRTWEEIHNAEIHRSSVFYSKVRSVGSLVMYTLVFPKNHLWQSLTIVAFQTFSNYIYRIPDRWNYLQDRFQRPIFESDFVKTLRRIGLPESVIDYTGRVTFSLGHSAIWAFPTIVILGAGDFDLGLYIKTVLIGNLGSANWDETFNKYANGRGGGRLSRAEFVELNFLRTFTYLILSPLIQKEYLFAEAIGVTLAVTGLVSFFAPAGFLKLKDFIHRVETWNIRRTRLTSLNIEMEQPGSCYLPFSPSGR